MQISDHKSQRFKDKNHLSLTDIESENLIKRGGSIQAALNLEFKDLLSDKIELKLEGSNGKLPNLDLFNTVIRICKSVQFKCSLASEKSPVFSTQPHSREPANHIAGLHNIISMVFKQSTGLSSSSHGFFLEQRIEALTMTGKVHSTQSNKKVVKQNVLKMTRFTTVFLLRIHIRSYLSTFNYCIGSLRAH